MLTIYIYISYSGIFNSCVVKIWPWLMIWYDIVRCYDSISKQGGNKLANTKYAFSFVFCMKVGSEWVMIVVAMGGGIQGVGL